VHEATDRGVAFFDASGELRLQYGARPAPAEFALMRPQEGGSLTVDGQRLLVKPAGKGASPLGYIAIGGTTIETWDELALEQAAGALALELSKQQAVQQVELRAGSDFLHNIIGGSPIDLSLFQAQAHELGYDLKRPHTALLIAPADAETSIDAVSERMQYVLQAEQTGAPYLVKDSTLLCLYPEDRHLGQLCTLLRSLNGDLAIGAGISTVAPTAAAWPRAYEEARQALSLGRQLFGPRSVTQYQDLHVYRLLFELRVSPELRSFHETILGALVEYDRRHHTELLRTLEGYFEAQGNLRETAERLAIHRNTLLYRLRRISQIADVDMDRTEDMLALQLALKAHRVLTRYEG
jgi:PucR family transcriptional regulator, purine catabolism regulatory protein